MILFLQILCRPICLQTTNKLCVYLSPTSSYPTTYMLKSGRGQIKESVFVGSYYTDFS